LRRGAPALAALLLGGCYDFSPFATLDGGATPPDLAMRADLAFSLPAAPTATFNAIGNATSIAAADFDGDGKTDLAVTNFGGTCAFSVLLGNGDGTFRAAVAIGGSRSAFFLRIADFNGDQKPDVALVNGTPQSSVEVYLGLGDGNFAAPTAILPAGSGDYEVLSVGDLNGDGKPDVATSDAMGNQAIILLGKGDGTFEAPSKPVVGNHPRGVVLADLDGDGKVDLAAANVMDSNVTLLLGNGDGTVGSPAALSTGGEANPFFLTAGDVDGDGKLDLVTSNNNATGSISVLRNQGQGMFAKGVPYPTGGDYAAQATIGDVSGDGHPDVVVANFGVCCLGLQTFAPGTVSVHLGRGDGTFDAPLLLGPPPMPDNIHCAAVADLDGDKRPDVVASTRSFGTILTWRRR
jgi:hypothetical protein